MTDLAPAAAWGGRALLVETGMGAGHVTEAKAAGMPHVPDLAAAARFILGDQTAAAG